MTDWRAIAAARGLGIPDEELDRVASPLHILEETFRPLTGELPASLEPETTFHFDEELA